MSHEIIHGADSLWRSRQKLIWEIIIKSVCKWCNHSLLMLIYKTLQSITNNTLEKLTACISTMHIWTVCPTHVNHRIFQTTNRTYVNIMSENALTPFFYKDYHLPALDQYRGILPIDQSHNASVPYLTINHSKQKCAHFCSEWCILGYGTSALWDRSVAKPYLPFFLIIQLVMVIILADCGQYHMTSAPHWYADIWQ